jgi:hypothetical protein
MDQGVTKCVKLNCYKFLLRYLLASMEAISSATQLAKSISVLHGVIWIGEEAKQVSLQAVQDFQPLSQLTKRMNAASQNFRSIHKKRLRQKLALTLILRFKQADMKQINKFIENHQQNKEEENDRKVELPKYNLSANVGHTTVL